MVDKSLPGPLVFHLGKKPQGTMKFFIFTCLLAVSLAKHEVKNLSSSEESVNISEEEYKQYNDVIFQTSPKTELTKEELVYLKQLSKINQFYQELNLPQYLQAYNQYHIVRNPWNQIKINDYSVSPSGNKVPLCQ
uniref:alpha-S2-casein-like isoform X2 n=1 Tax=Halichoerus grypus TaxID=9711 RepID=UPI001659652C|nr:alpha-S2-casein-like isoform X2 [Halichoerus grypus]